MKHRGTTSIGRLFVEQPRSVTAPECQVPPFWSPPLVHLGLSLRAGITFGCTPHSPTSDQRRLQLQCCRSAAVCCLLPCSPLDIVKSEQVCDWLVQAPAAVRVGACQSSCCQSCRSASVFLWSLLPLMEPGNILPCYFVLLFLNYSLLAFSIMLHFSRERRIGHLCGPAVGPVRHWAGHRVCATSSSA